MTMKKKNNTEFPVVQPDKKPYQWSPSSNQIKIHNTRQIVFSKI